MTRRLVILSTIAAGIVLSVGGDAATARGKVIIGSGKAKIETRPVSGFSAVDVSGAGTVTIEVGNTESLTVTGDDNLLPLLETKVRNGVLVIAARKGVYFEPKAPMLYKLRVKRLTAVTVSGAVTARGTVLPQVETLTVSASGASSATFDSVSATALVVDASGSSAVKLKSGMVEKQTVTLSGASRYDGFGLMSGATTVTASGASNAEVSAKRVLIVKASGASTVRYKGEPSVKTNEASGAASVTKVR